MEKQGREESRNIRPPLIPQTPMKPIAPICPYTAEEQSNWNQADEWSLVGNRDMTNLDHLSFGDLLALANTASSYFRSLETSWPNNDGTETRKGNEEAVESLSSVSKNNVAEHIKTPEKPKRKKHRPKVVKEAKPKTETKPRKPPRVKDQESKTPRRKYLRKKQQVNKDQESTPVQESPAAEASTHAKKLCRRALDFEDESSKPENGENKSNVSETKHADDKESKQSDSVNQESDDCFIIPAPSTPKRKLSQRKRKGKEQNGGNEEGDDIFTAQASKRRQAPKEPTHYEHCDNRNPHWLDFTTLMRSDTICSTSFDAQEDVSAFDSSILTFQETNALSDKRDTPIKKKTIGHARYRNLSAINKEMEASVQLQAGRCSRPHNNNNALVETLVVTSSKKKRAAKSAKSQTKQITSPSPDELWNQVYSVEAISQQLRVLDINRDNSGTALVPYYPRNQITLVDSGAGAIVPATPVKKRRPRAKVDIDNETDRVWKLLMDNIDSEGVDGSAEQKAKWWEEERNVFRGRANTFISRMHLVQGDRRFTPWKGSVVDSVVGVFLTQNVSDHLSSSAFMSLVAEYPAPSVPSRHPDVGTSSIQITYLDSEESISKPPVTLNITQPDEEKEYVNISDETSRGSSDIISSEVDNTNQTCIVQDLFPTEDSVLTFQNSLVSDAPQNTERGGSSSEINSKGEHYGSYVKLQQALGSTQVDTVSAVEESNLKNQYQEVGVSSNPGSLQVSPKASPGDCSSEVQDFVALKRQTRSCDDSNEPCCCSGDVLSCQKPESSSSVPSTKRKEVLVTETLIPCLNESTSFLDVQEGAGKPLPPGPDSRQHRGSSGKEQDPKDDSTSKAKGKNVVKEKTEEFDWDSLRREAQAREGKREKTERTMDSVDWEAIRRAHVSEVAETIKSRGMNHKLAERIQAFLNRLVTDHGSIDLEWLRDVPPDKAKEYLMSFRGLGLKSVECVRLLTLHHLAFPVDTNVGRIAVRLGWVPLQPLPESLQLHLLEMYPVLESIQKYLWPRLCKLDQKTLYELHYQMITFGKVFCTKSKPNCNACPMRAECRHFASAFASARLSLPGTEKGNGTPDKDPLPLHLPEPLQREQGSEVVKHSESANRATCCEPIIEEPASPEPECPQVSMADIEDAFYEDPEEIPTIQLNMDEFTSNLKKIMEDNKELQDGNMSNALVALTAEAASIPMPKLKNISQLRTEHQVYELPDSHPLLAGLERREHDDPCSYLLAIWTPGETVDSIQPAVSKCMSQGNGMLCNEETCFSCNTVKEARSQTVRGTILIPCRTAMRGSFPLNGTYFQVNEVFADHASSLTPIDVPRQWVWDLHRRTVYFGTSIPTIFKGLPTETIQQCFWRGYVCVRGFDRKTRGPKPLIARLHFPASKMKSQANQPSHGAA
uniref:Protein ROS1 n=1 Tax=Noccaea caerulescens TaxID=107243 RepID=A0A1J3J8T8_NOCCA